ncbi:MAG: rRNA maturation RNase YbeY [Candidatus Saccharimonadales bacterium]
MAELKVNIKFAKNIQRVGLDDVNKVLTNAWDMLDNLPEGVINVLITTKQMVHDLNKKYAGKAESTDVLSFNYREDNPKSETVGDIVISREHIAAQAKKAKISEETETALLALHGVLHLSGYDHQTKKECEKLDKLQKKLMLKANLKYRDFEWLG